MDKTRPDRWEGYAITSFLRVAVVDGTPVCAGKGLIHTAKCGLGWRFEAKAEAHKVTCYSQGNGLSGHIVDRFSIEINFDPLHIARADYSRLTVTSHSELFQQSDNLEEFTSRVSTSPLPCSPALEVPPVGTTLGPGSIMYHLPNTAPARLGTILLLGPLKQDLEFEVRVTLPSDIGLDLPPSQPRAWQDTLKGTMLGDELVDITFRLPSRRLSSGVLGHPKSLYASSKLLRGRSTNLDLRGSFSFYRTNFHQWAKHSYHENRRWARRICRGQPRPRPPEIPR
ncbi:hypothetical protein HGRIS_002304 [Hohenbuehelia grisea]|uniref:Arrestin-like N-terminal domain-containing protein n=1 Tax=Hohenbuehelia grisea TaxID=104357 RepID=A0ABR3JM49_9AGAR